MDVQSVFLNATLEEGLCVILPEGLDEFSYEKETIVRLIKCLYGLKQASKC